MRLPQLQIIAITALTSIWVITSTNLYVYAGNQETISVHYAPEENLEHIDVALINTALHEIDFASYVLTDVPVIEALTRAATRGVHVRLYLYEGQFNDHGKPYQALQALQNTPGVMIKFKSQHRPLMHLKSYQIDGYLLRSGAANLSASGLKLQDNDLIIINDKDIVQHFKKKFDAMWEKTNLLVYKDNYPTFQ